MRFDHELDSAMAFTQNAAGYFKIGTPFFKPPTKTRRCNPNRLYETMTRWRTPGGQTIRVWCEHPRFVSGPHAGILNVLSFWNGTKLEEFLHYLCEQFPDIAAIEHLDAAGNGTIIYPDWR